MQTASTLAWVLHDVGLAAGFGGNLFGKVALNPAVMAISSRQERGKILSQAWNSYKLVDAFSVGTAAVTWFIGRSMLTGKEADRTSRGLVLVKDLLLDTTVANLICGSLLSRGQPGGLPVESGNESSRQTPAQAVNIIGDVNLVASAGVIGVTAALAMRAGRSPRWSLLSRFLP